MPVWKHYKDYDELPIVRINGCLYIARKNDDDFILYKQTNDDVILMDSFGYLVGIDLITRYMKKAEKDGDVVFESVNGQVSEGLVDYFYNYMVNIHFSKEHTQAFWCIGDKNNWSVKQYCVYLTYFTDIVVGLIRKELREFLRNKLNKKMAELYKTTL